MWDKIKEAFKQGQKNLRIENAAKQTFDLAMQGAIPRDNAVKTLLDHHRRATSNLVKNKIINRVRTIVYEK